MRTLRALALASALAVPALAFASEDAHGGDGHHATCTAASSDHECFEYWEKHINWWSWDYKAPHADPSHRHMPPPFGFAIINFAIFAGIMYRLAAKPLFEYTRTRHLTIKKDLDEAAALRAQAEAKLKEYEAKIAGIDKEIADLLAQIKREAELEKARIIEAAAAQAARLKADAETQIRNDLLRTQRALRREAVAAALAAAETILRQKVGVEDQKRLAERYVAELEGPKAATAART